MDDCYNCAYGLEFHKCPFCNNAECKCKIKDEYVIIQKCNKWESDGLS